MKRISDLTPEDFPIPIIDRGLFKEWKEAKLRVDRIELFVAFLTVLVQVVPNHVHSDALEIYIAVLLVCFFYLLFALYKVNRLAKQIGINRKNLRQAMKSREVPR